MRSSGVWVFGLVFFFRFIFSLLAVGNGQPKATRCRNTRSPAPCSKAAPSRFKAYQNIAQIINYNFILREKTMLMKNEEQEQQREREGSGGTNRFVMVFQRH